MITQKSAGPCRIGCSWTVSSIERNACQILLAAGTVFSSTWMRSAFNGVFETSDSIPNSLRFFRHVGAWDKSSHSRSPNRLIVPDTTHS